MEQNIDSLINLIVNSIDEGIIITSLDSKIKYINEKALNLMGISFGDAIDFPLSQVLNLSDDNGTINIELLLPDTQIQLEGVIYENSNIQILSKKGETYIINIKSSRPRNTQELNIGTVITIEDMSDNQELERMKMDFIAMSEDVLRTPISAIRWNLQNFIASPDTISKLTEKELEYINTGLDAANELRDKIESLLTISEIHKGEIKYNSTKLDLGNVIAIAVSKYKQEAAQKGLRLVYAPPRITMPMILGDQERILDVLGKFLSNAIKFTDSGDINIEIKVEENQLKVMVRDTGRGIPKNNLPHVFTKFYRVKEAISMSEGSGLSLYVCKKIIEGMGGQIGAVSIEGKGSTFWFTVPIFRG